MVDGSPIRVFSNNQAKGIPYPNDQAMGVYGSLWDGEDWATEGGRIKTDWTQAPFNASYRMFNPNACVWSPSGRSSCNSSTNPDNSQAWLTQSSLDARGRNRLRYLQSKFMIYNYCTDYPRFPQGVPPECKL